MALITVCLTAARNQRRARPKRLRMIDRRVQLDHVSAWYNFIQDSQRRRTFHVAQAFAFPSLRQRLLDFNFTQTLDQGFHTCGTQRLD
jgi:hypothetical protein